MRAVELTEALPAVGVDEPALRAVRLVVSYGLPGMVVTDKDGQVIAVIPLADVLRFVLPPYVEDQPCLARVCDDTDAGRVVEKLTCMPVRNLLPDPAHTAPTVRPQATVVELAEVMTRGRSPLVVVRQGQVTVGLVTAGHLLDHLVRA